jgi:UDP-N-acetylglucosamine:LPS N-acetylglucosamine transferase
VDTRVLIVSGSVGAGHDGAAHELASRLTAAGVDVVVRDFLAAVPRPVATLLRDGYTTTVAHVPAAFELLFRRLEHRGFLWAAERTICRMAEAAVSGWVAAHRPDVVVSTYPPASQTIGDLRASGRLAARTITYLTDPAVHVSWLHPAVDDHLTVTTTAAAQGRRDYGVEFTVGGPLVPARFGTPLRSGEAPALRRELGLPAGGPVALLVAGSLGLGDVPGTVRDVARAGVTPLVLCARNEPLRRRIERESGAVALGWRTDVDRLVHLADVMVQNAGGLSFTEALVAGLPAVTYRAIPGHGRANAAVLDAGGLAPWARTADELGAHLWAVLRRPRTTPRFPDPARHVLRALAGTERSLVPAA